LRRTSCPNLGKHGEACPQHDQPQHEHGGPRSTHGAFSNVAHIPACIPLGAAARCSVAGPQHTPPASQCGGSQTRPKKGAWMIPSLLLHHKGRVEYAVAGRKGRGLYTLDVLALCSFKGAPQSQLLPAEASLPGLLVLTVTGTKILRTPVGTMTASTEATHRISPSTWSPRGLRLQTAR